MAHTIAALLGGRDNNFNLIRFIAASAVLVDHCFALVAPEKAAAAAIDFEALEIGRYAVDVFFVVSGFLVTRSVLTQPTLVNYAAARVLRLFPALIVVCIFTAFLLGPLVTLASWGGYFADPRTWLYVPVTSSLLSYTMTLPGVFDTVPLSGIINTPLWTLRYEAICYVALGLFALAGLLATRYRAGLTLAAILCVYLAVTYATDLRSQSASIDSMSRFAFDFLLGGAFYIFADRIRLDFRMAIVLGVIAVVSFGTPLFEPAFRVALAYSTLWFALVPSGAIRRFNLMGDYSYGIYILCFPIQQTMVMLNPGITPFWLFVSAFPAVLALAILSWHFVEHPALRQKAWAGDSVGSLLGAGQQRLTSWLGLGAAPKPQETQGGQ
jgi:peptidoglycan/LPS O-acetylase OafA/YrhL